MEQRQDLRGRQCRAEGFVSRVRADHRGDAEAHARGEQGSRGVFQARQGREERRHRGSHVRSAGEDGRARGFEHRCEACDGASRQAHLAAVWREVI